MKTKIYKICGVALAVVLIVGLAGAFIAPTHEAEAQAYVANQWNVMPLPSPGGMKLVPGSDVTDMAVGPDGTTIYVVDAATGVVARSTSGGAAFAPVTPAGIVWAGPHRVKIAVAPDDPNVAAVVDMAGNVWVTSNGGSTWANLAPAGGWPAGQVLADIQIGPARAGTLLGRDYAVCTYDAAAATFGDIWLVGTTATWASIAVTAGINLDWTSIALAPNWVGDRVILGVGSGNAAGGNPEVGAATVGDTFLVPFNCGVVPPVVPAPFAVRLDAAAQDSPAEITGAPGATNGEIVFSDITLPADFDSTSVSGFRAYLGWTSSIAGGVILCADDVYRVDFNAVKKLEVRPSVAIYSVSYFGTVGAGTLMVGETGPFLAAGPPAWVWFSSDPMSGMPTWGAGSAKPPNGGLMNIVAMTSETDAFAGSTGAGTPDYSGVYRTLDGGLSWNGISFIDMPPIPPTAISDVMPSPDGSVVFMACLDATGIHSLWRGNGLPNPGGWELVHIRSAAQFTGGSSLIRLSPEYGTDSTLYWFDWMGTTNIRKSTSNGQIWSGRTAPAAVWDACVESADVLYVTDGGPGNVYPSTNGAWFFGLPVNPGIGPINDIAMAPSYPSLPVPGNILAAPAAAGPPCALSTDSAATWRPLVSPVAGATLVQIIADADYANNNTVYMGSATAGQGIYRYEIGTSSAWELIDAFPGYTTVWGVAVFARMCTGLAMVEGTSILYGSWMGAAAVNSGADRSLVPELPVIASWVWDTMDAGSAMGGPPILFNNVPNALRAAKRGNSVDLWTIDTATPSLYCYEDTMALADLDVSVPDEVEASLAENARGWNAQFAVSWGLISNATDYEVQIATDPGMTNVVFTAPAPVPAVAPWFIPANPLSPTLVVPEGTLVAGQDYFVRLRARDQTPNDAIRSPWSSVHRFTVQGGEVVEIPYLAPQPLGPTCGSTGNPQSPGFTWSPFAKATRYEFQLATDAAFTNIVAEAKVSTTGYAYEGTLDYEGTYFWRVRAIEPTTSDWSPVCAFTVEKKEVPPPPPVEIVQQPPAEPVVSAPIIWAIIGIGAVLVIAVIVLIVRTRRAA